MSPHTAHTPSQGYAGTVYLLHLDAPLQGARNQHGKPSAGHYLGWTRAQSPARRIGLHARGQSGSKFMAEARREGIGFVLARIWTGVDRHFERKLKRRKASARICPVCRAA